MASKPIVPNHLLKFRKSIASIQKDIAFLNNCLKFRVTPNSHKIKLRTVESPGIRWKLEKELIKDSIKNLYSKLENNTRLAYTLHLQLAKMFPREFEIFYGKVKVAEACESERKRKLHEKKLKSLLTTQPHRRAEPTVSTLDNFVVNRSSESFSPQQMDLLNNGLNFAISAKPNIEQTIIDIEAGISACNLPLHAANSVRSATSKAINTTQQHTQQKQHHTDIIKELRNKPVYYMKADKGNALVIMDTDEYDRTLQNKLDTGPYRQQRLDPLPTIVKKVDNAIKTHTPILGEELKRLKVTNPSLPRIKGIPKIHKPGNEMREIVSAVGAPTQKLAKWLVKEFRNMPKQASGWSVKNSVSFSEQLLASGEIGDDEIMVSFDVTALYPSIPVGEAMDALEDWLLTQYNGQNWKSKVRSYVSLTRTCMEESYFVFRGNFYKQLKGAPMGNPLSSIVSDIFMCSLETKLHQQELLPEKWWRYVDDVFSIVKRADLPRILESINKAHRNIHFTHEVEKEGKLPFLDILVTRETGGFLLEIYRKPTNTMRVIPNTSSHPYQHKMAAFHHMVHRMVSIPLSPNGVNKETEHIFETARLNGYPRKTIQTIIDKKLRQHNLSTITRLIPDKTEPKRICIEYNQHLSHTLNKTIRQTEVELVYSSRKHQLTTLLGSTKDPIDGFKKSGIYEVGCSHCDKIYIGQTRRTLDTRLKEHLAEVTKAHKDTKDGKHHHFKSKIAEHIFTENHTISTDDAKIVKQITNPWKLDTAESIEIHKRPNHTLLNRDIGNGHSWLFKHLPTPTSYNTTST